MTELNEVLDALDYLDATALQDVIDAAWNMHYGITGGVVPQVPKVSL